MTNSFEFDRFWQQIFMLRISIIGSPDFWTLCETLMYLVSRPNSCILFKTKDKWTIDLYCKSKQSWGIFVSIIREKSFHWFYNGFKKRIFFRNEKILPPPISSIWSGFVDLPQIFHICKSTWLSSISYVKFPLSL